MCYIVVLIYYFLLYHYTVPYPISHIPYLFTILYYQCCKMYLKVKLKHIVVKVYIGKHGSHTNN